MFDSFAWFKISDDVISAAKPMESVLDQMNKEKIRETLRKLLENAVEGLNTYFELEDSENVEDFFAQLEEKSLDEGDLDFVAWLKENITNLPSLSLPNTRMTFLLLDYELFALELGLDNPVDLKSDLLNTFSRLFEICEEGKSL